MADVQPLRALHYDLRAAGPLGDLIAPPYDVIDAGRRAELVARSPAQRRPRSTCREGDDPYAAAADAARALARRGRAGARRRARPVGADPGLRRVRRPPAHAPRACCAAVRVEEYGPGRIRPHERTHPGPREDRLRLTRATRANLSPIFALHSDPAGAAWAALAPARRGRAVGRRRTDDEGTEPPRVARRPTRTRSTAVRRGARRRRAADRRRPPPLRDRARVRRRGRRRGRRTATCSCAWSRSRTRAWPSSPPTAWSAACAPTSTRRWPRPCAATSRSRRSTASELVPRRRRARCTLGYIDSHFRRPVPAALRDQAIADAALRRQAPTPTAGSTPRCWRRCCSRARWG